MALKKTGTIEIPGRSGQLRSIMALSIQRPAASSWRTPDATASRSSTMTPENISRRLAGFPEAAGVVADDGQVLVTNRGAASLAWVDAISLKTRAVFKTGPQPNGVAIVSQQRLAIAACIGDDSAPPDTPSAEPRRRSGAFAGPSGPPALVRHRRARQACVPRDP